MTSPFLSKFDLSDRWKVGAIAGTMAVSSNKDIAGFMRTAVGPQLGTDYFLYKKKDLARMRGPFLQLIALSISRSGSFLRAHPTLYVAGADPSMSVISQNLSLEVWSPRKWSFESPTLDRIFAERLLAQIESETSISFVQSLTDTAIESALRRFASAKDHWNAQLFLAFLSILQKRRSARDDLAVGRKLFGKLTYSRVSTAPPWVEVLSQRFEELERRIDSPDGVARCEADSERHAELLRLPKIVWPADWPTG